MNGYFPAAVRPPRQKLSRRPNSSVLSQIFYRHDLGGAFLFPERTIHRAYCCLFYTVTIQILPLFVRNACFYYQTM